MEMQKHSLRDASGRFAKGPSQGQPKGPSQGHSSGEEEVFDIVEREADAVLAPEMDLSSDIETADEDCNRRKRPSSSFLVPGYLDSDTETEGTAAAKVSSARRGREKSVKAAPSREVFLKPYPVSSDTGDGSRRSSLELEKVLRGRQFKKGPAAAVVADIGTGSESDAVPMVDDLSKLNAQELRAQAGEKLACILEVARKSGNLKGEFVGRLKRSASTLAEVVDALAARSEAEETRRLRADNGRLRLETESLKEQVKALRRGFTEAKSEAAAAANAAAAAAAKNQVVPTTVLEAAEMVEELKRSLTITFGQMLNARLAGVEERLPPAQTLRPPLRADAKRVAATAASQTKAPQDSAGNPHPKVGKQASQGTRTTATLTLVPDARPSTSRRAQDAGEVGPPTAPQAETWATVVRKGKGKGKGKSSLPLPAPANAPTARASGAKPKPKVSASKQRVALKPPKSAAVVLSLQPQAAEEGVTYSAILKRAQEKVDLQELGIDQLRFRQTATGARMLEIPGSQNSEKADRLAEKLRDVLSDVATIARPVKSVDLRITGLDDAATKEMVAAAVAKAGGCEVRLVKAGEIRPGLSGAGSALITCPTSAAKVLVEKGRLLIGWSSVRVVALEARPMRCFRCMGLGHTRPQCPASADRGDLCFRCGGTGHKAASCGKADPRCAICAASGKPSGHVMGGRKCAPPKTKGKAIGTLATPLAAAKRAAPEEAQRCEEVAMSD